MRITTRFDSGLVTTRKLTMVLRDRSREVEILVFKGARRDAFCLRCPREKGPKNCDSGESPPLHERIPGTQLPWMEIALGICGDQRLSMHEDGTDERSVVRIDPADEQRHGYSLLYLDGRMMPERIERYGQQGQLLRTLNVLEAKRMPWGTGIKRAVWSLPNNAGEVLVEVLSVVSLLDDLH